MLLPGLPNSGLSRSDGNWLVARSRDRCLPLKDNQQLRRHRGVSPDDALRAQVCDREVTLGGGTQARDSEGCALEVRHLLGGDRRQVEYAHCATVDAGEAGRGLVAG